jgi:hypothetical protein
MKAAAILAALALPALAPSALAQQVGQYAVTVVPSPNPVGGLSHALIVDTKNGYVWEWVGGGPDPQGLSYQGQVKPGKDSSQTAEVNASP